MMSSSSRPLTFWTSPSSSSFDWPCACGAWSPRSVLYKITIRFQFSESTGHHHHHTRKSVGSPAAAATKWMVMTTGPMNIHEVGAQVHTA
jgi:hypothetical protein